MSLMFVQTWMGKSRTVGSVWPTSSRMAKKMASVINLNSELPVLELGPGTGAITQAILATGLNPEKLYAIEYTQDFFNMLRTKFPKIKLIKGDAFDLDKSLGNENQISFDCAISSLPLLNFPATTRIAFIEDVLSRLPLGRPLVQFSYGPFAPVAEKTGHFTVKRFDIFFRNIPPAQVWIYRRETH
jgi:phosphatidylethanolamine/phosphatidyl-N-methylethanolamine N-methyltransferase